jgi:hypothetical protein
MSAATDTDADLAAIRSDLSNLKGDVASLIEHFTGDVGSGVQGVSNQITEGVRCVSENPAANGKQTARAIGLWVERRPPLSLGVALGVGYLGARAFSRRGAPRCTRFHQTRARRGSAVRRRTSRQNGRNDDFATCERIPLGRGRIAMAPIPASGVSTSPRTCGRVDVGLGVSVRVNQGGVGGEVVR